MNPIHGASRGFALASVIVAGTSSALPTVGQEVLVSQQLFFVQVDKAGVFPKSIDEMNSAEGRAIVADAAYYLGVDPAGAAAAVAATDEVFDATGNVEASGIVRAPEGYTI